MKAKERRIISGRNKGAEGAEKSFSRSEASDYPHFAGFQMKLMEYCLHI